MKAYTAYEENEGYAVIVFAETAGKARVMRKTRSLFDEYEVIECSNGLFRTLSLIPTGGGYLSANTRQVLLGVH